MRIKVCLGLSFLLFLCLFVYGLYEKGQYKDMNQEKDILDRFAVGLLPDSLFDEYMERAETNLDACPIILAVKCLDTMDYRIDMMGYVIGYKRTIVRAKIFVRLRRQFLRAERALRKGRNNYLSLRRSQMIICYAGYLIYTDSTRIKQKLKYASVFDDAKHAVSHYTSIIAKENGKICIRKEIPL